MTDPTALTATLEQRAAFLAPISARMHVAAAHPPLAPTDWKGPASEAYTTLEARVRSRLAAAEHAVDEALRGTRAALGELDG